MSDREAKYRDGNPTFEVVSKSSGNTYYLSKNSTAARERGVPWSCNCMAWIVQKKMPCKHLLADKRISYPNAPVLLTTPFNTVVPEARGHTGTESKKEVEKAFADDEKERASQAKNAKREERDSKKLEKLSVLRYGFQLAHTYTRADFLGSQRTVVEVKYDGELGMIVDGRIINRSGNDITNRFPEIEKTSKVVLVGELVVLDSSGMSVFKGIQERATDDPMKIKLRSAANPATFVAFDILERNGKDLTDMAFSARRAMLEDWYNGNHLKGVELIEQIHIKGPEDIDTLLEKIRELGARASWSKTKTHLT